MTKARMIHYTKNVRPDSYGAEHGCFANARDFVYENGGEDSGLLYCEGLCYDPAADAAFHHAWCVDPKEKANYETSPLDYADFDALEYWGYVIRDAMEGHESNEFAEAVLKFRDLAPLAEAVRKKHPDAKVLGADAEDPKYWEVDNDGATDQADAGPGGSAPPEADVKEL